VFLEIHTSLLIDTTNDGVAVGQELVNPSLVDDPCLIRFLGNLLNHLDEGVGDGHAGEAFLAAVSAWRRVATEAQSAFRA